MDVLTFPSVVERLSIAVILHGENNVYLNTPPHHHHHLTGAHRLDASFINKAFFSFTNSGMRLLSRLEEGVPYVSGDIIVWKKKTWWNDAYEGNWLQQLDTAKKWAWEWNVLEM